MDPTNGPAMGSRSSRISIGAGITFLSLATLASGGIDRCGHHSHLKLSFAQFSHNLRNGIPWRFFVRAHVNRRGAMESLAHTLREQVDVHRLVVQKRSSVLCNAD